ncbi:hypothetical protein QVD17_27161 [Tagetes erecta]|uniref:Glycosyltransferase 61 catalytic domain-containing protein n=1 Tax=Tagetes erecta TaxID=13708 RepID=A0AAD8NQT4_TARER|nr:hypothetical protein QVD17_27161 [Tagetes erecta]
MEGHRRMVCGATQMICLLAFIYLFYTQSFGFDPIKLYSGTRNLLKNATKEEVGILNDSFQPLFESLIGDDDLQKLKTTSFACDSTINSLVCVASNPVKIDTKTMEIYTPTQLITSTNGSNNFNKQLEKVVQVRPYAWSQFELLKNLVSNSIAIYPSTRSSEVPKSNSIIDFKNFIRSTYSLKITNVSDLGPTSTSPVLLLVSRRKTRMFLNEDEMVDMMEELGFEVVVVRSVKKMSNLERFSKLVSRCSVLVGAHGAGLTNQMFLPAGAVVVQVVPLGLEWPSTAYFGEPAVRMGLHYLDYKIGPDESSLIDLYSRDHPVISDPGSVFAKGYYFGKEMYLDRQNMRVDVNRLKGTLVEALRLLKHPTPSSNTR